MKKARRKMGLSQAEAAEKAQISLRRYSDVERGKVDSVSLSLLEAISNALHIEHKDEQSIANVTLVVFRDGEEVNRVLLRPGDRLHMEVR